MNIEFQNSIRRLNFLCCLPDIKIAWINPCPDKMKMLLILAKKSQKIAIKLFP